MEKQLQITPYVVKELTPGDSASAKVYIYQPEEESLQVSHGDLFLVLRCTNIIHSLAADGVLSEVAEKVKERYYSIASGGVQNMLHLAVEEGADSFLQKNKGEEQQVEPSIHIAALVLWGGGFYYKAEGKPFFALARHGECIDLSGDKFAEDSVVENDVYILGTETFGQRIDMTDVQKILLTSSPEKLAHSLSESMSAIEKNALLAGLLVHVQSESVPDAEDVIELQMAGVGVKRSAITLPSMTLLSKFGHKVRGSLAVLLIPLEVVQQFFIRPTNTAEVYVQQESETTRSKKWIVVIVLALLLGVSVFVTYYLNKKQDKKVVNEEITAELMAGLGQVQELQAYDRLQAKRALLVVEEKLGQVQGVSDTITQEYKKTHDSLFSIETRSWEPISVSGSKFETASLDDGGVVVVSSETGELQRLLPAGGIEQLGTAQPLIGSQYVIAAANGVYGYHPDTGVWFFSFDSKSTEQIIAQSGRWGAVRAVDRYKDNVYILGPEVEELLKYLGIGGGQLSGGTSYFVDPLSYATIKDIAIDGHVYVLHEDGQIEKFLGGRRVDFSLQGVFPEDLHFVEVVTGVEYEHIYLSTGEDIAVFTVDGEYKHTISGPGGTITGLSVTQDESVIYIVTDSGVQKTAL